MKKLKILTWHVHGSYLYYLTQTECQFYIPFKVPEVPGYYGKSSSFPWGNNVTEIAAEEVKNLDVDCIIFQSNFNPSNPLNDYLKEQTDCLSEYQRRVVPKIFIEHDPPRNHPTDTRHVLYNSDATLVHVTNFNALMWDSGSTETVVIKHGVKIPEHVRYTGEINRGIAVVNNLHKRGRRLGQDIFEQVRNEVPMDLIGMGSEELGGLGEVPPGELASFISRYRFFFHPGRYASLGLTVLEAMMTGMPIIGLATTELATVIKSGGNGYIHTDLNYLTVRMKELLCDKETAVRIGAEARKTAFTQYSIRRFAFDWKRLISRIVTKRERPALEEKQLITTNYLYAT